MAANNPWRKTSQLLAPARIPPTPDHGYTLYPAFPIEPGAISLGFSSLARELARHPRVILEGYGGVFWDYVRLRLDQEFRSLGLKAAWHDVAEALRPEAEIDRMIAPFLGGDDPLFGTRFTGSLADFFDLERLAQIRPDLRQADLNLLYGCGSALAGWEGALVYVDVPKNEIQFRARAGSIANLGATLLRDPKEMYKRFYFVDWVALNRHKAALIPKIDLVVDEQRRDEPAWMPGEALRGGLHAMAHSYFRARPWFEPGAWGGAWIMKHIPMLPKDVPNYAWSFELISPENGLAFESSDNLLEVSFDFLMFQEHEAVLGASASRFGFEFPIRYDFLDTFDGGNLSVQVHPQPEYIRKEFGETFTQDEAYYILDARPGARVNLGFQAGVDSEEFRLELERSFHENVAIDIHRFVGDYPSRKHDFFLIPHGTIHGSGKDNLVLEISATPYIFTFKMYDWIRLDLDGKPRPLNIARAFDNLNFSCRGERVPQELISRPQLIDEGEDWKLMHLPTHPDHFYDVHRIELQGGAGRVAQRVSTQGSPHVLMVVEGDAVVLETEEGRRQRFHYAETFVVPAAAGKYRLINEGKEPVKVVKTFMK